MKYRATYYVQCDCGAKYGTQIENFESENDKEAGKRCWTIKEDNSPEKGVAGIRWVLKEFRRIDQEEKSTELRLSGEEKNN